jgi:hypothetical protein
VTIQEQPRAEVGEHRGVCAADRLCQACVSVLDVDAAAISSVFDGTNTGALGASGAPTASDENGVYVSWITADIHQDGGIMAL